MATALSGVIKRLRTLASLRDDRECPDQELLQRFIEGKDEGAFTALVERHGGLVLSVCRRVLRHDQDAEDACQATFLILVRKASSIRKLPSLASWLHGVAWRVAMKMRVQLARQPRLTETLEKSDCPDWRWSEVNATLDEELHRLPEKYKAPLVLCYLQAKTRDEAALELGWKAATFKGRLEWGRRLLRRRLCQRGLALSVVMLAASVAPASGACVPAPLAVALARSALAYAHGGASALGVAPRVIELVEGFTSSAGVKLLGVCIVGMALCLGGFGWFAHQGADPARNDEPVAADSVPERAVQAPSATALSDVARPPDAKIDAPPTRAKETPKVIPKKSARDRHDDDDDDDDDDDKRPRRPRDKKKR